MLPTPILSGNCLQIGVILHGEPSYLLPPTALLWAVRWQMR